MSVVLTNYTGGRSNWGCKATSIGLLDFLQNDCTLAEKTISTVPFPRGHELDKLHEINYGDQIRTIYSKEVPTSQDLDLIDHLVEERFGEYYYLARNADVIFFQGEGSIGPTNYLRNVKLFGLPFIASRKWKKSIISLNQTLYAASMSDRHVLGALFRGFKIVAVREAASYTYGKEMGLSANLVCCPDMAFRSELNISSTSEDSIHTDYFCVSGSALINKLSSREISRVVSDIAMKTGLAPLLLHSRDKDRNALESYFKSYQTLSAATIPDHKSLLPILAKSKFVFGGRYHTAVSALSQFTPIVLLPGNSFKSEGLSDLIGIDFRVFLPSEHEGIVASAQELVSRNSEYRSKIKNGMNRIKLMQYEFSELVRDVLHDQQTQVSQFKTLHPVVEWRDRGRLDTMYSKYNTMKKPFSLLGRSALKKLRRSSNFKQQLVRTFTDLP